MHSLYPVCSAAGVLACDRTRSVHPMNSPAARRRFHDYQDLMRHRIMDILLVSTPYDTFILEEAGELSERLLGEFRNLDLHYAPALTGGLVRRRGARGSRASRRT